MNIGEEKTDVEATDVGSARLGASHVLVVDDDPQLRQLVSKLLQNSGYRVSAARDGQEMFDILAADNADLILLDVMLPGASGLDVCRQIRRTSAVPIMMLTAKNEEVDLVVGLQLGADDYMAKPFGSRELLARVQALLRRSRASPSAFQPSHGRKYTFDGWMIDTSRRELINSAGVLIDLTSGEYDVLIAFVEAPQRVLTREQLLDLARNRTSVSGFDRSIDVQISRLRRKMGGEEAEGIFKTVRGIGYMFVPTVSEV